jgi:hypothetical protein
MVLKSGHHVKNLMQRLWRAAWTYRQPLTQLPALPGTPISDLFLWRKGPEWQTCFELTDMAGLFEEGGSTVGRKTFIRIFDSSGRQIAQQQLVPPLHRREQVDISALAEAAQDCVGTFAVFHSHTPAEVQQLGSHLTERGYVGYRFRNAPLRSYVHGNFDAVASEGPNHLGFLAGDGLLWREYRLQHELLPGSSYDIAIVNSSPRAQTVFCKILEVAQNNELSTLTAILPAGGCHYFTVKPCDVSQRVIIRSRLVMARPLLFRIRGSSLDVLHG